MKSCISIVVLVFVVSSLKARPTELTDEDRRQIGLKCLEETKADIRVINDAVQKQYAPNYSPEYKEFLACSYKGQGFQSPDGVILYDNIFEYLTKFYSREDLHVLEPCRHIKETTDAENAFRALECLLERLKTIDPQSST